VSESKPIEDDQDKAHEENHTPPVSIDNIGQKTVTNALWAYLSFFLGKGLTFVTTLVLARLLDVDEFGLMGFALVGIQYLDIFSRFGLDTALISRRDRVEEAANTIFIMSLITGTLLFGVAYVSAPFLADFFDADITSLFRLLSVVLLITSFSIVHAALLQRELRFRSKLIPDMGKSIVKGGTSIILASSGAGVWSLVWGQIAGELFILVALWILIPWRPSLRFNLAVSKDVTRFGLNMIVVGIIGALRSNVDYIFVGRILGAAALGLYTIAYRLPELIIRSLNLVVGTVAHPVLSLIQTDSEQVQSFYISYLRYISLLTLPIGVGLAVVSEPLVLTFYTDKWEATIIPLQYIALGLAISSTGFVPGVLYKALNRPDILSRISFLKLPILLTVLWYSTRFGINGVAFAQMLLAVFYLTVDMIVVNRVFSISMIATFEALAPAVISVTIMGGAVLILSRLINLSNVLELLVLIPFGAILYVTTLYFVHRKTLLETLDMVKSLTLNRRKRYA